MVEILMIEILLCGSLGPKRHLMEAGKQLSDKNVYKEVNLNEKLT